MRFKHNKIKRTAAIVFSFMLLIFPFGTTGVYADDYSVKNNADTGFNGWIAAPEAVSYGSTDNMTALSGNPQKKDDAYRLEPGDAVGVNLEIPSDGKYCILLEWRVSDGKFSDSTVGITIGSDNVLTPVYGLWQDKTKNYSKDRYGNEVTPEQILLSDFVKDYVRDSKSLDMRPFLFSLSAGESIIRIVNNDEEIFLKSVSLVPENSAVSYDTYLSSVKKNINADELIIIEAEDYAVKSSSYIRVQSKQNAAVQPYSPYKKQLSTIDSGSYNSAGDRVVWNFSVPYDAWYCIAFHYSQSEKEGQMVYRDVEIDGKALFAELESVGFPYTGNDYENNIVKDDKGEAVRVFLEKGKHTIGLFTQAPKMQPILEEISGIAKELSDIGLSLQQIAGADADRNRSWDIETYIPGVIGRLEELEKRLIKLYETLGNEADTTPASCINLKQSADIIKQILKEPEKLPARVSEISVGSGSATEMLASLQSSIRKQGMELDRIYLFGEDIELPEASTGFFVTLWSGIKRFFYSLFNQDNVYSARVNEDDVLNVWMNRSVTHVETLQLLADSYFTAETGIGVQLSVMPDSNKLLLSNASDTCPDIALGVPNATPYQLGLRGAAADLTEFSGMAEMAEKCFNISDLEPYVYDGKIFGLPETVQFYILIYRTDIFEKLSLKLPQTWEDVTNIMPVLRRNGMNFYLPVSSYTGTKGLDSILPFFFQTGTKLYSDDGRKAVFNTAEGIKAFETLTDLYSLYSLQNNIPSFYNNFRAGTVPAGVANFQNYMQILYAAPEIADSWSVALSPGTMNEDGTISRQQMSVDRASMIMESSDKKEEAWQFLQWWLSDDTQTEFSNMLLVKFGSDFVWNSANKTAFSRLALPKDDRTVIMEQWEISENYRNIPVTYMLERELSNAWYSVVEEGVPARIALNEAAVAVNSELKIKLREFNYNDSRNKQIRTYNMQSVEEILSGVEGN